MIDTLDHCWRRIGVYGGDHSCPMLVETLHCRNCVIFSDAARTLFNREAAIDDDAETQHAGNAQESLRPALVFRLGEQWLGLPPLLVAEVAGRQPIRRLAHRTTGRLEGVVNVRGELCLCVALGELLGLGDRGETGATARMVLVSDAHTRVLAFRCEEVLGLQHFPEATLQPPPDTLPEPLRQCVEGLFAMKSGTMQSMQLAMLDGRAVLALLQQALFA